MELILEHPLVDLERGGRDKTTASQLQYYISKCTGAVYLEAIGLFFLSLFLFAVVEFPVTLFWLLLMVSVLTLRLMSVRRSAGDLFQIDPDRGAVYRRELLNVVVFGLAWAFTVNLMFLKLPPDSQLMVLLFAMGLLGAVMPLLAIFTTMYLLFSVPLVIVVLSHVMLNMEWQATSVIVVIMLYYAVSVDTCRRYGNFLMMMIRAGYANEKLAEKLLKERKSMEGIRKELVQESLRRKEILGKYQRLHAEMEQKVVDRTKELTRVKELLEEDVAKRRLVEQELLREKSEQQALIEKLEQAQTNLIQSEKMASIGQLAAGVAHEINNPVGYSNSNILSLSEYIADLFQLLETYEAASLQPAAEEKRWQQVRLIREQVNPEYLRQDIDDLIRESLEGMARVKQIIKDLKDFSHVDSGEWLWVDIHAGLDSVLNIVNNEIKYKAEVVKQYGDLPQVYCLGSQINQVFMNMLVNAAQAIEKKGTITIATKVAEDNVVVSISDNGPGISKENMRRIFDPFFTTKPVGEGTGLGLALSYGIVQKHQGEIRVESIPHEGTKFTVILPINGVGIPSDEQVGLNQQQNTGYLAPGSVAAGDAREQDVDSDACMDENIQATSSDMPGNDHD